MRLVIDTNIWISYLISKKFDFIDLLLKSSQIEILYSNHSIKELTEVGSRKKFSKLIPAEKLFAIIEAIKGFGIEVDTVSNFDSSRDPKDNFLLELAVDGNADYLITRDNDLLVLNPFKTVKIITIAAFKDLNL